MSNNRSPLQERPDYLVCTCMGLMYSDIKTAIEAGNTTFEALQENLLVGTGCSSCVEEIEHMLKELK